VILRDDKISRLLGAFFQSQSFVSSLYHLLPLGYDSQPRQLPSPLFGASPSPQSHREQTLSKLHAPAASGTYSERNCSSL